MCGFIATISKNNKPFPKELLKKMTDMITHRGPDDEGYFFSEDVSFGFRRLKIIDLSDNAHQPMVSADGKYIIVFNGEIYNFCEIRKKLETDGSLFRSSSDTEVLLNAFIKWREKSLNEFIGMFAFLIYEKITNTIFFARDPLGIKPLYFYESPDCYFFTSEIKALLPYTSFDLNTEAINEYLVFRSLPGERTLFKNIKNILPGYYGVINIKKRKIEILQYFGLLKTFEPQRKLYFNEICTETEQLLKESIKFHMRSDVELGVQLSGGVDSSLITAILSEQSNRKKIHSFSISFDQPEYDESKYQKFVSEKYNTEHHDFRMTDKLFTDNLMATIWHYEHPLNDPNTVATYYLAQKAKEFVTVMLSGEGADESFLGYTKFLPEIIRKIKIQTFFFRNPTIRNMCSILWPLKKGKFFFELTKYPPPMFALSYAKFEHIHSLLNTDFSEMIPRATISELCNNDVLKEIILQDEICDLSQWLWRADKAGMAASLEFRVPFCTRELFSFANSIPYNLKLFGGERKAILKKIAEKYLPHEQIYRKKIGFGVPIEDWLKNKHGHYRQLFDTIFNSEAFKKRHFINHKHFNSLYTKFLQDKYRERNCAFLWTYLNLELWYRIYFEGEWKKFASS